MIMNARIKADSHKCPSITASLLTLSLFFITAPAYAQKAAEPAQETIIDSSSEQHSPIIPKAPETPLFDPDAPEPSGTEEPAKPSAKAIASLAMMDKALKEIDEMIERDGNSWQFEIKDTQILVVSDPLAGRMRIMSPIIQADSLSPELLARTATVVSTGVCRAPPLSA